jgi:hypothetical protein
VADCLAHLEPGLRLLDRLAPAGEVDVDLACLDAGRRLTLVLCAVDAGPEAVLRAVECAAWWGEQGALLARLHPEAAPVTPGMPPRTILVAGRFSERALRLLRALGALAPLAVECRVYADAEGPLVSLERLAAGPAAGVAAAPAPPEAMVAPTPPPAALPGGAEPDPAARARVLIERLERLRLSEAFR